MIIFLYFSLFSILDFSFIGYSLRTKQIHDKYFLSYDYTLSPVSSFCELVEFSHKNHVNRIPQVVSDRIVKFGKVRKEF